MADGYRIEVSANNRAGCQDALCKQEKTKILKGEIRFGVFVSGSANGHEFSGFKWRHWGCVSGKTIENIRHQLQKYGDGSNFNWEYLDGLEEMPSNYQEKIKTAIAEGKIADEDWNGDPEYNILGKLGIRPRASAKKNREDEEKNVDIETPSKPPAKKRGRAIRDDDEEHDEQKTKPAKRRVTGVKKEEDDEEEKARPVKSQKDEVKKEEIDGELELIPARKPRIKKGISKQKIDNASSMRGESEEVQVEAKLKPIRVKKGAQKEQDASVAGKESETNAKTMPIRKGPARAAKKEIVGGESEAEAEALDVVIRNKKPVKGSRGKKATNQKDEEASKTVGINEEEVEKFNANAKQSIQNPQNGQVECKSQLLSPPLESSPCENCAPIPPWLAEIPDPYELLVPVATSKEEKRIKLLIEDTKPCDVFAWVAMAIDSTYPYLEEERQNMVRAGEIPFDDWIAFLEIKFQKFVEDGKLPDDIGVCFLAFINKLEEEEANALDSWAEGWADDVERDKRLSREAKLKAMAMRKAKQAEMKADKEAIRAAEDISGGTDASAPNVANKHDS